MPRPAPISTIDNDFAFNTMSVRIPDILRDVINHNPDYPLSVMKNLESLLKSIRDGDTVKMLPPDAHDYAAWLPQYEEQLNSYQPFNWHTCDWFFGETFAYRSMMEAVRYFETGRDPFAPTKREEIASDALWTFLEQAIDAEDDLVTLLGLAVWGNRIDLSYAPAREHGTTVDEEDLLVDHREAFVATLDAIPHISMILDNFGTEFAMDLVVTDALLKREKTVALHLKAHPTFVSDAIVLDFWSMLAAMDEYVPQLSSRLRDNWEHGKLTLKLHPFWNSSYFLWEMPAHLKKSLRGSGLIVKGDANYRRMVGDAIWESTIPFGEVLAYMQGPVLALRVLKSEPVVGLPAGIAKQLDTVDEQWRLNGRRGVIQFYDGQA